MATTVRHDQGQQGVQVVKAQAATSPKYPRTIRYRGDGAFMVSGREVSFRRMFRRENL
jgi:hypothetical protein